jgi:hypothetical protein
MMSIDCTTTEGGIGKEVFATKDLFVVLNTDGLSGHFYTRRLSHEPRYLAM